jgi:hypothetical protein
MFTVAAITSKILSAKFKNRSDRAMGNSCACFPNQTENSVGISRLPPKIKYYAHTKDYSIFIEHQEKRTDLGNNGIKSP